MLYPSENALDKKGRDFMTTIDMGNVQIMGYQALWRMWLSLMGTYGRCNVIGILW